MKNASMWAWAISVPLAHLAGNTVWLPYWIFAALAWFFCAKDVIAALGALLPNGKPKESA